MTETPETETTDSGSTADPTEEEIEAYWRARELDQPDIVLAAIVESPDPGDVGFGLTLTVGGSLVSGVVINRLDWANQLVDEGHTALKPLADRFAKDALAVKDDADPMPSYSAHVHMKDVQWFGDSSGSIPSTTGTLWRGRLSQVQGFSIGSLTKITTS